MEMIEQYIPQFNEAETTALAEYISSSSWLTEYLKTAELESMIAKFTGSKHCVMMPNGTLALYAALMCLSIGWDDNVLVPDLTMIATANAVRLTEATPRFVDICEDTLCFGLDDAAVDETTKAAIVVSLNGRAPDMQRAQVWAQKHSILLIEDACQAFGSYQAGQHLGTFGVCGIFSFSPHKIVTTGQGGCVVTNDDGLAHSIRLFKDFGRACGGRDNYEVFGINLKFTDLQAVVGIEQIRKIYWRIERKRQMFALYRDLLSSVPKVRFVKTDLRETTPWFIDALVEDREGLIAFLRDKQIKTRPMYPALRHTPVYHYMDDDVWVSDRVSKQGLWLPSSFSLTNQQIVEVCSAIMEYYRG